MRSAAFLFVLCAVASGALPVDIAAAQEDLVPEEEVMEAEGMPPLTTPPPAAAVIDTEGPAPSPTPTALSANAQLMDRLLITATEKTIREQKFGAATGIVGGSILLGIGGWRLSEDPPQSQFSRGLGIMFMTLGAADLTTGIFAATRISHEKRRLERWRTAKKDGITDLELARTEGELLSSAETREGERLLIRWNGLTHALAGMVVLGLSPVPDNSQSDRINAWVIGGIFIATGFAAFGLSFSPTPSEAAWNEYQAKKISSSGQQVSFRLSPAASRRGFGLAMSGTF